MLLDALGLVWGLAGGLFNAWMTGRLLAPPLSNGRIMATVILKPIVHLIILVSAVFVSENFMLFAAGADVAVLFGVWIKTYLDGRR